MKAANVSAVAAMDWMSEDTRKQALVKMDAFNQKIGYPDRWRDYSSLTMDQGPYVLNDLRATRFEFRRDLAKIGIKLKIENHEIATWVAKFYPGGKKFPGLIVPNDARYQAAPQPVKGASIVRGAGQAEGGSQATGGGEARVGPGSH